MLDYTELDAHTIDGLHAPEITTWSGVIAC
jgi:hypothetical protein